MSNSLVQLRIEDSLKNRAVELFSKLGLDLPTAIRMFLTRSVQVQGIPFPMVLPAKDFSALSALREINDFSENNGLSEMTLEEINEEISSAR